MPPLSVNLNTEQQLSENIRKNEVAAKQFFQNEQWVNAISIKLAQEGADFEIPKNVENIKIAKSRITPSKNHSNISDNDARTLAKEIRQAKILTDSGASVFILPKMKAADGREMTGPDAIVNGTLFEFKTITGSIGKVEKPFRDSREQSRNVFLRIMRPNISKADVISKIQRILADPKYTGGTKGILVLHLEDTGRTYFLRIKDLK